MQNSGSSVKFTLALICVMFSASASAALSSPLLKGSYSRLEANEALTLQFISHSDDLVQTLQLAPFEAYRAQIESETKEHLISPGEAQITVLRPAEWTLLQQKLTKEEIEKVTTDANIQQMSFESVCIGMSKKMEKDHELKTYFLVIKSPELLQVRHQLYDLYQTRKDKDRKDQFDPDHFNPQITLGFTDRDLQEDDGVTKNENSCVYKWTNH